MPLFVPTVPEALKIKIDHWSDIERQNRDTPLADYGETKRLTCAPPCPNPSNRQRAEQGSHCRHHDRTETEYIPVEIVESRCPPRRASIASRSS